MAEWVKDRYGVWVVSALWLRAKVQHYADDDYQWWIEGDDSGHRLRDMSRPLPFDEAKAAAEQALRAMHEALSKHFAPVLTWSEARGGVGSIARVGGWFLFASDGHWSLRNTLVLEKRDLSWLSPIDYSGDEAQARRAAEAALRSLGVVFRTEGER